ncbi:hypothetical protein Fmac_003370 [Flemingia macrophylla]|uniref:Fatty acid hydroxylase domain-containing protein n=1 Tax=Flemingia macrophylla TaxID=520843 RepID=A0ABD1NQJ0_9FABA
MFMASYIEPSWQFLITRFSDFQLSCLGTFFLSEVVFFLSGVPYLLLERTGWLRKYKIQFALTIDMVDKFPRMIEFVLHINNEKNTGLAAQKKCITRLILYHLGVNLPIIIISYPLFKYMGMRNSLPLPSWYATPFGLNALYAHPVEILFLGFATIIGPALTGPHLLTLWIWVVVRVLETVEVHCGYHFPWSLANFLPLYAGADHHDYHHRLLYTKSGNYSSTFTYMDWIFGTDIGYRKLKASKNTELEQKKH